MGRGGTNLKVVFFGTSEYCLPVLEVLKKDLILVVTREDKPVGRKQILTPSATKTWALKNNLPTSTTLDIDCDLAIVSDYGSIIKHEIYERPKFGTFNIHFSKLPELRGPSPVQATLLRGDANAWVTIYKLVFNPELAIKMDSGPILWQKTYPIFRDDTTETLYARLFREVAKEIPGLDFKNGKLIPQDHSQATFCKMLTKDDGFVNFDDINDPKIYNKYRAFYPWPGLWTLKNERRMKILKCHLAKNKLFIDEIQFEGKNPQPV